MNELRQAMLQVADPDRAPQMKAYMKHRFPFLGVSSPLRKRAQREFVNGLKGASGDEVVTAAEALWEQPEREFHYVGMDLLRRWVKVLEPEHLIGVRGLIQTHSWWDTVDLLASRVVGPMVQRHGLQSTMDVWIDDPDLWVARTAILHQLSYKDATDEERLFAYCSARADHRDFFIRKAIGWSLREYGKTAPAPVVAFVEAQGDALSGLSRREALKHLR